MPLNIIIRKPGTRKQRLSREHRNAALKSYYQREIEQGSRFYAHDMSKKDIKRVLTEDPPPE